MIRSVAGRQKLEAQATPVYEIRSQVPTIVRRVLCLEVPVIARQPNLSEPIAEAVPTRATFALNTESMRSG
jgi:hypothetical protein